MLVAAAGQAGSVLNPAYYSLVGAATGERAARSVTYDAQTRTAYVSFGNLSADDYTLTADAALTSRNDQRRDRQVVVKGKSVSVWVDIGGRRVLQKNKKQ